MSIGLITNQIISGITLGFSYALVGAGISLIWGTLKMINLAHGELYMLGAYFAWLAITLGRIPVIPSILIGIVCVVIVSLVIQLTTVRPLLKDTKELGTKPYVLTMGLSILLQNSALLILVSATKTFLITSIKRTSSLTARSRWQVSEF